MNAPYYVHPIFETLAFLAGLRYYFALRKKRGDAISDPHRLWILAAAGAGALLGSRILGALEHPAWLKEPTLASLLTALNNKTIVGGLLGGVAGVEIVKKILGETRRSGDLFVFPILLAMMVGRVGCLLTSLEDRMAGVPTSLPWGVDFGDGIPRHPLMLYELHFLGASWIVLEAARRRCPLEEGSAFKLFMAGYLLFRGLVEFLKPDWRCPWGLTAIKTACLLGIAYYWPVYFRPSRSLVKHA